MGSVLLFHAPIAARPLDDGHGYSSDALPRTHLVKEANMLRSTQLLRNYVLEATDGEIGRCKDFLFDDQSWVVRYMVANTHKWLPGRKVLIPVTLLGPPDWDRERFPVHLTRESIKASPPLDDAAPVSRIEERRWARYYGYGAYWAGPESWGAVTYPHELRNVPLPDAEDSDPAESVHIRSAHEVVGYQVHAVDGIIGRVSDVVVQDTDWRVVHLACVLDARVHRPKAGGELAHALVSPNQVVSVDWANQMMNLGRMMEDVVPPAVEAARAQEGAARL